MKKESNIFITVATFSLPLLNLIPVFILLQPPFGPKREKVIEQKITQ
jgi:hypothetical protein